MNRRRLNLRTAVYAVFAGACVASSATAAAAQPPPATTPGANDVRQSTPAFVVDSTRVGQAGQPPRSQLPGPEEGVDRDGDGIPTLVDFCPDSPPASRVDETGCEPEPTPWWILAGATLGVLGVARIGWVPFARWQRRKRLRESRFEREPTFDNPPAGIAPFQAPGAPVPWTAPPMPTRAQSGGPSPAPPAWPVSQEPAPPQPGTPRTPRPGAHAPGYPSLGGPMPSWGPPTADPTPPSDAGRVGFPAPPGESLPGGGAAGQPSQAGEPDAPQAQGWWPPQGAVPASEPGATAENPLFQSTPAHPAGNHHWGDQPLHYEEPKAPLGVEWLGRRPFLSLAVALVVLLGALALFTKDRYIRPPGPSVGIPTASVPTVVTLPQDSVRSSAGSSRIPAALRMVDGDAQRGRVGRTLPTPVAVQVEDENGDPIPGVAVMFEATVGGGAISPIATQTDSSGIARTQWTLGPQVIKQYVVARVAGSQAGVAFEADATPGVASRVAVVRGEGQNATPGEMLTEPVVVRVEGADGRPLEGVLIRFASDGGGAANPVEGMSDPTGEVSTVWTIGESGDSTVLRAEVADAPGIATTIVARAAFPSLPARSGVVAGGTHSCALSPNGNLTCWGGNQSGQLGTGGGRAPTPRSVGAGERFADVSAGLSYACGIGSTGVAYCWGDNASAQLGDGSRASHATPRPVAADVRFRRIVTGNSHTCAISREGSVFCWGSNSNGQLGDGTRSDRDRPTRTLGPSTYDQVAVGWFHTCSLTPDGRASCWGRNAFGQLGDGTTNDHSDPGPVGGSARYRSLSAGGAHTCGLGTDGVVYCWGQNNFGQLGDGGNQPRTRPTPVTGGPWRAVTTGGVHTCALDSSGSAFCWGRNTYGQLGDGTTTDQRSPQAVQGGLVFATISASSGAHTCGSTASGEQYCWGYNVEGQLGDGSRANQVTPTRVGGSE